MSTDTNTPGMTGGISSSSATQESITVSSSLEPAATRTDSEKPEGLAPTEQVAEPASQELTADLNDDELDQAPDSRAKRDAIRYRQRLRETEAKLSSLAEIVIGEKLNGLNLGVKALRAADVDLTALFDDEGAFDDARLLASVVAAHEKLGIAPGRLDSVVAAFQRTGKVDWRSGVGGGYVGSAGTGSEAAGVRRPTFEEAKRMARERVAQQRNGGDHGSDDADFGRRWSDLLEDARHRDGA